MKKLFVHLSILCLLAVLLVPMVGCKKEEPMEESPAATTMEDTGATDTMGTDMGTPDPMGTDMGGTTEPMGTDTPPAQ